MPQERDISPLNRTRQLFCSLTHYQAPDTHTHVQISDYTLVLPPFSGWPALC